MTSATGANGRFSGHGLAVVPWFNSAKVRVTFKDIAVNSSYQLTAGEIVSVWDPKSRFLLDDKKAEAEENGKDVVPADSVATVLIAFEGAIDSVYIDPKGKITVLDREGNTTTYDQPLTAAGDKKPVEINDGEGNGWRVDREGNVSSGSGNGGSDTGNQTPDQIQLLQEKLIVEVLEEFETEIKAWLDTYGKGPLSEEELRRALDLPNCLPEDEEALTWISEEKIPAYKENPTSLLEQMNANDGHKALLSGLIGGLDDSQSVKSQLESEQWKEVKEATCDYLQDGVEEALAKLYVSIEGTKYKDGETAIVKREYKKEITLMAYQGNNEITEELSWMIDNESQTGISVVFDAATISADAEGQTVTATLGNKEVTVKIVVAEVILHRNITMAVSANLYPTISPEGIADQITFESDDEEILRLSEGYPTLNLTAGKPGETTITAKAGRTVFHQKSIKVINEPEVEFVRPVVSNVNFDNVTASSINYTTIMLPEVAGGAVNGLCSPEIITIDEPEFFYLKGDKWYPYIERVEGEYFFDYRLIDGQQEVTGPGGNTTVDNYCEQVMVLGSIPKYNHGPDYQNYYDREQAAGQPIWYMLEAVREHEKVHEPNVIDAYFKDIQDSLFAVIENELVFDDQPQKSFSEIENENFVIVDLVLEQVAFQASKIWLKNALVRAERDHDPGGAAEQAEYAVINPMIEQICNHSKLANWQVCDPDACNEPLAFGPEIPYIIDVTDPANPVSYDLSTYVNIPMGDREEVRLRLSLENSMVIGKEVNWKYTFDGGQVNGSREIVFRKDQLKDTPEIVNISYQYSQYNLNIKH